MSKTDSQKANEGTSSCPTATKKETILWHKTKKKESNKALNGEL